MGVRGNSLDIAHANPKVLLLHQLRTVILHRDELVPLFQRLFHAASISQVEEMWRDGRLEVLSLDRLFRIARTRSSAVDILSCLSSRRIVLTSTVGEQRRRPLLFETAGNVLVERVIKMAAVPSTFKHIIGAGLS